MSLVLESPPVPLREDSNGVLRIGLSRVTLQTVVAEYQRGSSPEQIVQDFDTLSLQDVYAVINYYLHNRQTVEDYLEEQQSLADEVRARIEADPKQQALRRKLLERRQ